MVAVKFFFPRVSSLPQANHPNHHHYMKPVIHNITFVILYPVYILTKQLIIMTFRLHRETIIQMFTNVSNVHVLRVLEDNRDFIQKRASSLDMSLGQRLNIDVMFVQRGLSMCHNAGYFA